MGLLAGSSPLRLHPHHHSPPCSDQHVSTRPSKRNTISLNKALRVVQSIILILEKTNERYPKSILLCFSTVSIFLILGTSRIEIDTVFKDYFPSNPGSGKPLN